MEIEKFAILENSLLNHEESELEILYIPPGKNLTLKRKVTPAQRHEDGLVRLEVKESCPVPVIKIPARETHPPQNISLDRVTRIYADRTLIWPL